jgi:hypothetical protein
MKEDANSNAPSRVAPPTASPDEFNRRLTLLKAEVDLDFTNLVPHLESGLQLVLITDKEMGKDLDPDALRRIGGMTMLCRHYGAGVFFINTKKSLMSV